MELYQKIEALIGLKMEQYPSEQEAVLVLLERVGEAQRIATMQVGGWWWWGGLAGSWMWWASRVAGAALCVGSLVLALPNPPLPAHPMRR